MAKNSTRGSNAQFTYDFGIAIAQSTITKLTRLTGVTLSLASAYYALKSIAEEYVIPCEMAEGEARNYLVAAIRGLQDFIDYHY